MHSNILCFSNNPNDGKEFNDANINIDDVQKCAPSVDYMGYVLDDDEMKQAKQLLASSNIFPSFIKFDGDKIVVSADSKEMYKQWFKNHWQRIEKYHEFRLLDFNTSPGMWLTVMRDTRVCTESDSVSNYEKIEDLFVAYDSVTHPFIEVDDYNEFIERLAFEFSGQTLYLCTAIDIHY